MGKRYAKLCAWVEENIKETLSFYRLPRQHHKNLKSTNMLERSMEEIKRRTLVVRIFPNAASPAVKEERRVNHESPQDRLDDTERTEILRALEAANGIVGDQTGGCSSRNKTFHTPASHAEVWYSRVANADGPSGLGREPVQTVRDPSSSSFAVSGHFAASSVVDWDGSFCTFNQARRLNAFMQMQNTFAGIKPYCDVCNPITQTMRLLMPETTRPVHIFLPTRIVATTVRRQDR